MGNLEQGRRSRKIRRGSEEAGTKMFPQVDSCV